MEPLAAGVAVGGLGVTSVLHLAWAAGSSWPANDREQLADLVFGHDRPMPGAAPTVAVAGLLAGASGLLLARRAGQHIPLVPRRLEDLAVRAVPAALALRGLGGLVTSGLRLGRITELYRRWDLRLYSPLCLLLAASSATTSRTAPDGRR
ncbi:MAG: DUF3995 domain-containing protein [Actinomycetota bacterium]|nr:DUF3995 domain-containing protein [Actinomycetota bacterium]